MNYGWTFMTGGRDQDHPQGKEMQKQEVKKKPGVTGKFGLGVQNEAGQRLIEFCQENILVIANTLFQQHKRLFYT